MKENKRDYDWIFSEVNDQGFDENMEKIEEALGFKLFLWQKYYIRNGEFRCYGRTTAEILRMLLDENVNGPIDLSSHSKHDYFYHMAKDIKNKLDRAGIKTNPVIFGKIGMAIRKDIRHVANQFDMVFDDRKNASNALIDIKRVAKRLGYVTLRDAKDICNVEPIDGDEIYGWDYEEVEKTLVAHADGDNVYVINLPRALLLV